MHANQGRTAAELDFYGCLRGTVSVHANFTLNKDVAIFAFDTED